MIDAPRVTGSLCALIFSCHFPSSADGNSIHLHAVFNYGNYHRAALQGFGLKPFREQKQGNSGREKLPESKKETSGGTSGLRGESHCLVFIMSLENTGSILAVIRLARRGADLRLLLG